NVSRTSVIPSEIRHTIKNDLLRRNGPTSSLRFRGLAVSSSRPKRLTGFDSGSTRPTSAGDCLSSSAFSTKRISRQRAATRNIDRHPRPPAISKPMNCRDAASPNRKLRLITPIAVPYDENENHFDVTLTTPAHPSD